LILSRFALSLLILIVSLLFFSSVSKAQTLENTFYSSEDDLLQALYAGDIDYQQYQILLEIIYQGIDSTNQYLLDNIPNQEFFDTTGHQITNSLQDKQREAFVLPELARAESVRAGHVRAGFIRADVDRRGQVTIRYRQRLREDSESRYRNSLWLQLNDNWKVSFKIHKEYDGAERFMSRSILFKQKSGVIRELRFGNFTRRFGLGTVAGYRGRLLETETSLGIESLLYPDYGGYNGLFIGQKFGSIRCESIYSLKRNSSFRLVTTAGMISWQKGAWRPGIIIGLNYLKNRSTGQTINDLKTAAYLRHRYHDGIVTGEVCIQTGARESIGGGVVEWRHRFRDAEMRFALWVYGDSYLDLSGDSKAGNIYHTEQIDEVGFDIASKRSGQEGGMVKTIVQLSEKWQLVNSFLYAGRNHDTANYEWLTGIVNQVSPTLSFRVDHLSRIRNRVKRYESDSAATHRTKFEMLLSTGNISTRVYIAYNGVTVRNDYASLYINLVCHTHRLGRYELVSNLSQLDVGNGFVKYWYLCARNEQRLWKNTTVLFEIDHTFHKGAIVDHETTAAFNIIIAL